MSDLLLPVELRGELISYITSACAHRPFGEVQGVVSKLAMLPVAPESLPHTPEPDNGSST